MKKLAKIYTGHLDYLTTVDPNGCAYFHLNDNTLMEIAIGNSIGSPVYGYHHMLILSICVYVEGFGQIDCSVKDGNVIIYV